MNPFILIWQFIILSLLRMNNGLSVLPYNAGTYVQAPFEDCSEEQYNYFVSKLNAIDLKKVIELEDNTDLKGELACAGGACEVI